MIQVQTVFLNRRFVVGVAFGEDQLLLKEGINIERRESCEYFYSPYILYYSTRTIVYFKMNHLKVSNINANEINNIQRNYTDEQADDQVEAELENQQMPRSSEIAAPCNLVCNWSIRKDTKQKIVTNRGTTSGKSAPPTPHAYKVLTTYQKNRFEAIRCRQEEERKMREFHARPMPNFQTIQNQLENKKQMHLCTVPETPKVLKESRENSERRRKKVRVRILPTRHES